MPLRGTPEALGPADAPRQACDLLALMHRYLTQSAVPTVSVVTLRCSAATTAAVLVPDVTTCTSIIHVVDSLLLPGNVSTVPSSGPSAGDRVPADDIFAAFMPRAQAGKPLASDVWCDATNRL